MDDVRRYSAYPSNVNVLTCFRDIREYFRRSEFKENQAGCDHSWYRLEVDDSRLLYARDFDEFMDTLEQFPHSFPIHIHSHWDKRSRRAFGLTVDLSSGHLEVSVSSSDLHLISGLHERLRDIFQASNPPVERAPRRSRYGVKKTVFLAHRFDEYGKGMAARLETFLRRLGFGVVEGAGYETRDIPDKVAEKIATQDIFICVATPGDPSWILSETSYAKALDKYMILMCQEDVQFKKGILGQDCEYLPFPKENIEKAFSDLLYALPH